MKGASGLVVALILGILGGALNFVYLQAKTRETDNISFISIAKGVTVKTGETLRLDQFAEVRIPAMHARNLQNVAYLWVDHDTINGIKATREYHEGDLVFRQDYRTAPAELKTPHPDDVVIWISVDSNSFVPSLVNPGDEISFLVQTTKAAGPNEKIPLSSMETIGPFRIASLGIRLASPELYSGRAQGQERQIGIIVKADKDGKLEPKALRLKEATGGREARNVSVIWHPRQKK